MPRSAKETKLLDIVPGATLDLQQELEAAFAEEAMLQEMLALAELEEKLEKETTVMNNLKFQEQQSWLNRTVPAGSEAPPGHLLGLFTKLSC